MPKMLAMSAILLCSPLLTAQDTFWWLDGENNIVTRTLGQQDARTAAVSIQSDGQYLLPRADSEFEPFHFFLENGKSAIVMSSLGIGIDFGATDLTLPARYDVATALAAGVDPCHDLLVEFGGPPSSTIFFPPPPPAPAECAIPGDVNFDGSVSFDDFLVLADNFGSTDATWRSGDFDWDGEVQFSDFRALASNFGMTRIEVANVPEPNSILLAAAGLLVLLRRRGG